MFRVHVLLQQLTREYEARRRAAAAEKQRRRDESQRAGAEA